MENSVDVAPADCGVSLPAAAGGAAAPASQAFTVWTSAEAVAAPNIRYVTLASAPDPAAALIAIPESKAFTLWTTADGLERMAAAAQSAPAVSYDLPAPDSRAFTLWTQPGGHTSAPAADPPARARGTQHAGRATPKPLSS